MDISLSSTIYNFWFFHITTTGPDDRIFRCQSWMNMKITLNVLRKAVSIFHLWHPVFLRKESPIRTLLLLLLLVFIHFCFQIVFEPSKIYFMTLSNCYSTQMIGGLELFYEKTETVSATHKLFAALWCHVGPVFIKFTDEMIVRWYRVGCLQGSQYIWKAMLILEDIWFGNWRQVMKSFDGFV